jgi:hypothetical protein
MLIVMMAAPVVDCNLIEQHSIIRFLNIEGVLW